jgi:CheY-like chemotaxis protein
VYRAIITSGIGVGLFAALLASAPAQDQPPPDKGGKPEKKGSRPRDEYPDYFKTPETLQEYWDAVQFELEVGKTELAARLLSEMLKRATNEQDLVDLDEKVGTAALLKLRVVPKWSDDPKINQQAIKDANELADKVSQALRNILGDPKRIAKFIHNLSGDQEEHDFAARELYRSRSLAIPYLVEELRTVKGEDRDVILALLPKLAPETVMPLTAALDIPDDNLRVDLIEVFVKRGAKSAVPFLWHLAGSPKYPERVRNKALSAIVYLTGIETGKLPPAPVALTREAERYYRHQVPMDVPGSLVWRWDGKALVTGVPGSPKATPSQAEEYYGLRFAREALDIDPTFLPAQVALLSLALDKGMERSGVDQPLAKAAPDVQELIATVNPDLVILVLERALAEKRTPVVLGAARALGELAEPRALRPTGRGEPALVQALTYPDRRVQMATAEAMLRIPAAPSPTAAGRVVDVLRRAAAIDTETKIKPTALVGFADDAIADAVAAAVRRNGWEVVKVHTGNEALRRLKQAADVDALLIDSRLPDPGLAYLLAQLREDPALAGLPLWLVMPLHTQEGLRDRLAQIDDDLRAFRRHREALMEERQRTEANYLVAKEPAAAGYRTRLAQIDQELTGLTAAKEDTMLADRRRAEQDRLTAPPGREPSLRRLIEHYRNVWLLPESAARDAATLRRVLADPSAESAGKPLTDAERKDYAERSLQWLARIAKGELAGYDFRPAADALYQALQSHALSDGAITAAIEATSRLPGSKPQGALAAVVADTKRTVAVRTAAASELLRTMQQGTPALSAEQLKALDAVRSAPATDVRLREAVALVIGATRPDARQTGERLKAFEPRPPAPKEEKKEEKKDEGKDEKKDEKKEDKPEKP